MVDSGAGATAIPGWYPDPIDAAKVRWWDGSRWADQAWDPSTAGQANASQGTSGQPYAGQAAAVQGYAAQGTAGQPYAAQGNATQGTAGQSFAGQPYTAPGAPAATVAPGTPVYNPWIWAIALLPILPVLALIPFDLEAYLVRSVTDPLAGPDLSYLPIQALSFVVHFVSVLLAYFDWRRLGRDGYLRPFHWAWGFLGALVYVIGRSVIVKRRAGRGYAPIWVIAAAFVISMVVVIAKFSTALPAFMDAVTYGT